MIEKYESTEIPKFPEISYQGKNYRKLMAGIFTGKSQEMYDLHEKSRIHRINHVDTHN